MPTPQKAAPQLVLAGTYLWMTLPTVLLCQPFQAQCTPQNLLFLPATAGVTNIDQKLYTHRPRARLRHAAPFGWASPTASSDSVVMIGGREKEGAALQDGAVVVVVVAVAVAVVHPTTDRRLLL
jgi:hypothetical protein